MGNREFYKKKLEVISAIDDSQIKKAHHIPVSVYIEEADTLYHRALQDKEELVAAGVARELIEDLPQRLGALIEAEKKWQKEWKNRNKSALEWDKQSPAGYDLRKRLLADFYYAFRKEPDLMVERGQAKILSSLVVNGQYLRLGFVFFQSLSCFR